VTMADKDERIRQLAANTLDDWEAAKLARKQEYERTSAPPIRTELDDDDLKLGRIPLSHKHVILDKVQGEEVRELVGKYIKNIDAMLAKPVGLLITGESGVGKSAIASLVAMEARKRRKSTWRLTFSDVQKIHKDRMFLYRNDGQSAEDRIQSVELLIFDDFNEDFVKDLIFGPRKLESCIKSRIQARKATILTTRLTADMFKADSSLKSLYTAMQDGMVGLTVEGENLCQQKHQQLRDFIKEQKG
jgi:DNA replication protein DnaC